MIAMLSSIMVCMFAGTTGSLNVWAPSKGMQGVVGLFEDEFRARNIHAIWMPHALPDKRTVPRSQIRQIINDYMFTVMGEEPLDPSLLDFDDIDSW